MLLFALLPALAAAATYTCTATSSDPIPALPTFPLTIQVVNSATFASCSWVVPAPAGGQLSVSGTYDMYMLDSLTYSGNMGGFFQTITVPSPGSGFLPSLGPLDAGTPLSVAWSSLFPGGGFTMHVTCSGCSSTVGDPHFRGLAGQKYLIGGEPGTVYNIISTPSLLVNALFGTAIGPHRYTVMQELGIVVGTDTVFANKYNRLQLNGVAAPASAVLSDGVSTLTRDTNKTGDGITLRTPEFVIRWRPRGYEIDLLGVSLLRAGDATVHGLLGQTWNSAKWPASAFATEITDAAVLFPALLDGSGESDYAVRDGLFGHEFAFSTFDSGAYPEVHAAPAVSKAGRKAK